MERSLAANTIKHRRFAIKLFVSSTFNDMQFERNVLETIVFPQIHSLCESKGLSFFPIDLRWGISEERQQEGKVATICLEEVDNSRPYFIGILGNKYGTRIENSYDAVWSAYPYIKDFLGCSLTELEMRHGILNYPNADEMKHSFYIKSYPIGDTDNDDLQRALIEEVKVKTKAYSIYHNIEDFASKVLSDLTTFINETSMEIGDISDVKQSWYVDYTSNDYVESISEAQKIDHQIMCDNSIVLVTGKKLVGKTARLTNWANKKSCKKLIINLNADRALWDTFELIKYIHKNIIKLFINVSPITFRNQANSHLNEIWRFIKPFKTANDIFDMEIDFGLRVEIIASFVKWLEQLELDEKFILLINDVELLNGTDIGKYLNWLPSHTTSNFKIVVSSYDPAVGDCVKRKGYRTVELEPVSSTLIMNVLLKRHGKELSSKSIKALSKNKLFVRPGVAAFMANALIAFSSRDKVNALIGGYADCSTLQDIYRLTFEAILTELSDSCATAFKQCICAVNISERGLSEDVLFLIALHNETISKIEWIIVRRALEVLLFVKSDRYHVLCDELRIFISKQLHGVDTKALSKIISESCSFVIENSNDLAVVQTAIIEKIVQECNSKNWNALVEIVTNYKILDKLLSCDWMPIRRAWTKLLIKGFDFVQAYHAIFSFQKQLATAASMSIDKMFAEIKSANESFEKTHGIRDARKILERIHTMMIDLYLWHEWAASTSFETKDLMPIIGRLGVSGKALHIYCNPRITEMSLKLQHNSITDDEKSVIPFIENIIKNEANDFEKVFLQVAFSVFLMNRKCPNCLEIADNALKDSYVTGDLSVIIHALVNYSIVANSVKKSTVSLLAVKEAYMLARHYGSTTLLLTTSQLYCMRLLESKEPNDELENILLESRELYKCAQKLAMEIVACFQLIQYYDLAHEKIKKGEIIQYLLNNIERYIDWCRIENYIYDFEKSDTIYNIEALSDLAILFAKESYMKQGKALIIRSIVLSKSINFPKRMEIDSTIVNAFKFFLTTNDRDGLMKMLKEHFSSDFFNSRPNLQDRVTQLMISSFPDMVNANLKEKGETQQIKVEFSEDFIQYYYDEINCIVNNNGICAAEDALFQFIEEHPELDFTELAHCFYSALQSLSDEELIVENFSRQEIEDGYLAVLKRYAK